MGTMKKKRQLLDRMHVSLRPDQVEWLENMRDEYGIQVSPFLRRLIDREMKRQKPAEKKKSFLVV